MTNTNVSVIMIDQWQFRMDPSDDCARLLSLFSCWGGSEECALPPSCSGACEWNRLHRFLKACSVFLRLRDLLGTLARWRTEQHAFKQAAAPEHRCLESPVTAPLQAPQATSHNSARRRAEPPGPQRLTFTLDPWNNNYGIPLDTAACAFTAEHPAR